MQRIPGHGQEGRAGHRRRAGQRQLAQVPASLSAFRKVLPRFVPADQQSRAGDLPGRRVRQLRAAQRGAGLRTAWSRFRCARHRKPPVVPQPGRSDRKDAVVFMSDVYAGGGLKGVPRGTVKKLRLISYHYSLSRNGRPDRSGRDGRAVGRQADHRHRPGREGRFGPVRVPAYIPGRRAAARRRRQSRATDAKLVHGMPGETASCVGCHENQNSGAAR